VINSSCTTDTGILTALVNTKTGEPIPDFPVTVQAIRNLRGRSIYKCLCRVGVLILSMQATN
jgi:hypothetical protein